MIRSEALEILGFAADATPSDLVLGQAYRNYAKKYHPDNTDGTANRDEFDLVSAAWDYLRGSPDAVFNREVYNLLKKHIDWIIDQIADNRHSALNSVVGVAPRNHSAVAHFRRINDAVAHVLVLLRTDLERYTRQYEICSTNIETFEQILQNLAVEPETTFNRLAKEQTLARLQIAQTDRAIHIRSNNVTVAVIDLVEKHRQELASTYSRPNMAGFNPNSYNSQR